MSRNSIILLPKHKKLLQVVGENIKLARLRRKLTMDQVSERAGISGPILSSLKKEVLQFLYSLSFIGIWVGEGCIAFGQR